MGTLFVVATPIGNLQDITLRALETLKNVDVVLCEDTRVTKKLLSHYGILAATMSYHQHSSESTMQKIFAMLSEGKNLALVSDAGTPGISDPGNELISFIVSSTKTKQLLDFCTIKIVPIPGPSAVGALASVAGIPMNSFLFLGYPPHKNKRNKFFSEVAQSTHPVILYESPYRIGKTLQDLADLKKEGFLVVGRELTKKFETIYRGPIQEVQSMIEKGVQKGEFVLVVYWKT